MTAAIRIEITDPVTSEIMHRFRNFGEDVFRHLKSRCSVDLEEIDRSTNSVDVRGIPPREIGAVMQAIRQDLKKHNFDRSAVLTRLDHTF